MYKCLLLHFILTSRNNTTYTHTYIKNAGQLYVRQKNKRVLDSDVSWRPINNTPQRYSVSKLHALIRSVETNAL